MSAPDLRDQCDDEDRGTQMLGFAIVLAAQALIWFVIGYFTFEWMH